MESNQFSNKHNLQIIADIIGRELGLHYPASRLSELLRGFERTSELFRNNLNTENLSANNLIEEILKAKSIPKHLYKSLSSALTINETYFFRESPAINLFKTIIIKEIGNNNGNYKIWSAGCSSGEEPFTLAIIIKEMLPEHIAKNVTIIATDLSDNILKKANEGIYTQWSFRETPNNIRDKYFKLIDGKWHISDQIKKMVSFSHLNLISENYPSISKGINDLNLIFCRNVLMYFSHTNITMVTDKFYNSLCEGGWLVTSQVELNNELFQKFGKAIIDGGFFYRKEKLITPQEKLKYEKRPIIHQKISEKNSYNTSSNEFTHKAASTKDKVTEIKLLPHNPAVIINNEPNNLTNESSIKTARILANKGEYAQALEILEKLSNPYSLNSDFLYLYATILSEKGDIEKAAEYYKRCIYLNPYHILANYMLGNIYVELGKKELSTKYFRTALEQTRQMDPAQEVCDSGGMSAARIIELLENLILKK